MSDFIQHQILSRSSLKQHGRPLCQIQGRKRICRNVAWLHQELPTNAVGRWLDNRIREDGLMSRSQKCCFICKTHLRSILMQELKRHHSFFFKKALFSMLRQLGAGDSFVTSLEDSSKLESVVKSMH